MQTKKFKDEILDYVTAIISIAMSIYFGLYLAYK